MQAMPCQLHVRCRHGCQLAHYLRLQGELYGFRRGRHPGLLLRPRHKSGRVQMRGLRSRRLLGDYQCASLRPMPSWEVRCKCEFNFLRDLSTRHLGVLDGAAIM